jgi:hypothetical protein
VFRGFFHSTLTFSATYLVKQVFVSHFQLLYVVFKAVNHHVESVWRKYRVFPKLTDYGTVSPTYLIRQVSLWHCRLLCCWLQAMSHYTWFLGNIVYTSTLWHLVKSEPNAACEDPRWPAN